MKANEQRNIQIRIMMVGAIFSVTFLIIAVKLFYVHVFCGKLLSQRAADQYEASVTEYGKRGTVYDARHKELAVSIDVPSVAAYPKKIEDVDKVATLLAKYLKMSRRKISKRLRSKKNFVWIKRFVSPKETDALKNLELKGIDFISETSRFYPNTTLAAQVIGFTGIDGHGLEGIEFYYDDFLKGSSEKRTVLKDALGHDFDTENADIATYTGKNIILTIDKSIQYIAENAIEEAVQTHQAKSGIAIVMSPQTGEVLAIAHYPFFNPNAFYKYDRELWRNRAVTDAFEPGSTLKIFMAAAALQTGICKPSSIFYCENGTYRIGANTVHDTHRHGWLSLQQIVKYSSNIGAVKISQAIGAKSYYQTLKKFGFSQKTNIDCPGEAPGILMPYQNWTKIDTGAISFGQGISVSAIQLISAANAIANDGVLMKPYIVSAITDHDGTVTKQFTPKKVRRVISKEVAYTVRKIMKSVTTDGGTGEKAAMEGYAVCGKTGTAQKIDSKGTYARGKYVASFLGFVPVDKPELSILVVVDEPQKDHYGGTVAAPAFKKIAQETLNYLNVLPKQGKKPLTAEHLTREPGDII